ncbi:MAG: type restriction endonuclease subunit [Arthrobacter sp.]|nr:type restriction endonuclease subunit [Arthrobacter sp.]
MEVLDRADDEATMGSDDTERTRIEASVAVVNAVHGAPQRIAALAADLVARWEDRRARMHKFIGAPGKAMIVGGTREICAQMPGPGCLGSPPTCSDGTTVLKPRC